MRTRTRLSTRTLLIALTASTGLACASGGAAGEPDSAKAAETAPAKAELSLPNQKQPFEGVVTGGQPDDADYQAAADQGFKTVVSLRAMGEGGEAEGRAKAAGLGMKVVHIPMQGAAGLTEENAKALAEVLADASKKPLIVHCASGNRVGALFALKAFHVDGKSKDEALVIGKAAGLTSLEGAVKAYLDAQPAAEAPAAEAPPDEAPAAE